MSPITPETLEAWKRACAEIGPGLWRTAWPRVRHGVPGADMRIEDEAGEYVATIRAGAAKRSPSELHYARGTFIALSRSALPEAIREIERLEAECFKLAAGVCPNLTGDEWGHAVCSKEVAAAHETGEVIQKALAQSALSRAQQAEAELGEMRDALAGVMLLRDEGFTKVTARKLGLEAEAAQSNGWFEIVYRRAREALARSLPPVGEAGRP